MVDLRTSGRSGPFRSDEGVAQLRDDGGVSDVSTTHRSIVVEFRDAEQLLEFSWSHGQRAMWEAVPERERGKVRHQFTAAAQEAADPLGGITFTAGRPLHIGCPAVATEACISRPGGPTPNSWTIGATEVLVRELTYLAVLLACVLGTLPLEFLLQARVYRRWLQAVLAILPVAVIFILWDYFAARAGWWRFDRSYLTGVFAGPLPLEELLFFLVIPVCGLLTFEAVRHVQPQWAAGSVLADPELSSAGESR